MLPGEIPRRESRLTNRPAGTRAARELTRISPPGHQPCPLRGASANAALTARVGWFHRLPRQLQLPLSYVGLLSCRARARETALARRNRSVSAIAARAGATGLARFECRGCTAAPRPRAPARLEPAVAPAPPRPAAGCAACRPAPADRPWPDGLIHERLNRRRRYCRNTRRSLAARHAITRRIADSWPARNSVAAPRRAALLHSAVIALIAWSASTSRRAARIEAEVARLVTRSGTTFPDPSQASRSDAGGVPSAAADVRSASPAPAAAPSFRRRSPRRAGLHLVASPPAAIRPRTQKFWKRSVGSLRRLDTIFGRPALHRPIRAVAPPTPPCARRPADRGDERLPACKHE